MAGAVVLVPHAVTQNSADLWLAVTDSPARPSGVSLRIEGTGASVVVPDAGWRAVTAGDELPAAERLTWVQVVTIGGLAPNTPCVVVADGSVARFATLPAVLPRPNEPPFTVLLGSCFAAHNDHGVGSMMDRIARTMRPAIKILCGDQVYLDQQGFLPGIPPTAAGMARDFLAKYLRNWTDTNGFQKLLREGGTWFAPDDHEYWNNFPNPATAHPVTFFDNRRQVIARVARSLYDDFQAGDPAATGRPRQFRAGSLEFFIADTRTNRRPGNTSFQDDAAQSALLNWIASLAGPGVLVLGQPLFAKPAGFLGARLGDRSLANYEDQYPALAAALQGARHSVLVLSGDVHFGRVAETVNLQQPAIREVIASPSALVFGSPGDTQPAPEMFPAESSGLPQLMTVTIPESRRAGDNLATLEFTEASGVVQVTVRQWYIREPNRQPVPIRFRLM